MGYTDGHNRAREQAPMASRVQDPRPEVTRQDANRFVTALKRELAGQPGSYEEVFAVMRQFMAGSIETEEVVDQMKVLLSGHPDLIRAFNQFLPWGYIRTYGSAGGSSN